MNTALIPEEIVQIGESLIRFVDQEIAPIEQANKALLASDRTIYERAAASRRRSGPEEDGADLGNPPRAGILHDVRAGGGLAAAARAGGRPALFLNGVRDPLGPGRPTLIHPVVVPSPFTKRPVALLKFLEPGVGERYLPQLGSGEETRASACLAGRRVLQSVALKTRAVRDGATGVLTGSKQ